MIKVKLLNEDSIMPTRGSEHAAGLDLYSYEDCFICAGGRLKISTGVGISVGSGNCGIICARSKLASKFGVQILGGLIDADYTGEIMATLLNSGQQTLVIKKGDRIAQLIVQACDMSTPVEVKELDETWRGNKGVNCDDLRINSK